MTAFADDMPQSKPVTIALRKLSWADWLEKALITLCFSYFCWNVIPNIDEDGQANLLLLMSESLTVALVLFHRPTRKITTNKLDWFIAMSISLLPTFITPMTEESVAPLPLALSLMIFGFLLQMLSKGYLLRSFGIVPANRGIRVTGPYAIVRHPIYAGYFITSLGFLSTYPLFANIMIYSALAALQIRRIFAEEAFLSRDAAYRAYMEKVRYRLIPGVF